MVQQTTERRSSFAPNDLNTQRASRIESATYLSHYRQITDSRLHETLQEYKSHCRHLNSSIETYRRAYVPAIASKATSNWQLIKRKHNICVYHKHRKRHSSARTTASLDEFTRPKGDNLIKASGHLHGTTVQELLRGVLATTTEDLRLTSSMLHPNSFVDAHIVSVGDTDTSPCNTSSAIHNVADTLPEYQGFLSHVFKFPGIPMSLLRYRHFMCYNRIGTVLDNQSGETYGYYMLEAVDLPSDLLFMHENEHYHQSKVMETTFHDDGPRQTDSMERHLEELGDGCWSKKAQKCDYHTTKASLSFTWLLKQTKQDLVQVFVSSDFNLGKLITPRLGRHFIAQLLLSYLTNARSCYQAKLCTLVLTDPVSRGNFRITQHANKTKQRRQSFVNSEFESLREQRRQVCSICSVQISPLLLRSLTSGKKVRYGKILHCQACSHPVCRRCCTKQILFSKALLTKWSETSDDSSRFHWWKHSRNIGDTSNRFNDTEMSSLDPLVAYDDMATHGRWSDLQLHWQDQVDFRHFGRISDLNSRPNASKENSFSSLPHKGVFCLECICTLLPNNIASRVLLMNRQQQITLIQRKCRYFNQKSRYSTETHLHNYQMMRTIHVSSSEFSQPSFCLSKAQKNGRGVLRWWHSFVAVLRNDRKAQRGPSFEPMALGTGLYEEEGQFVLDTISPSTLSIARTKSQTMVQTQGSIRFTSISRTRESLDENRRITSSEMDEEMYSFVSCSEYQSFGGKLRVEDAVA